MEPAGEQSLFEKFKKSWHYCLTEVDLSFNRLLEVPAQLCQAQSLVRLNLSDNGIGNIPASLPWSCSRLATLILANNQLGDEGFDTVFNEVITGSNPRVSPFAHRRTKHQWQALHQVDRAERARQHSNSSATAEVKRAYDEVIELPAEQLFALTTLDLSGNQLVEVPLSVCHIRSLVTLNLSR